MLQPAPTLPAFYGSSLDCGSLECLTIARIPRPLLDRETELMRVKWWDYRMMHPAAATYLFVHYYNQSYGEFMRRAMDHKLRYMAAIKGKDVMVHPELVSFWRLRQQVDELGVPYGFFLRGAVAFMIARGWGKKAPHPPRPNHLLGDDELILEVKNSWDVEARERIHWAVHPGYRVENWSATPDQEAYQEYLVQQVAKRPIKRFALGSALYQYRQLRIERAIEAFPDELEEAIDECLAMSRIGEL